MTDTSVPSRDPVLVIDLQTGMFDGVAEPPLHDADALTGRVRRVLDWARTAGRKVAFVRHDGPPGDPLSPGAPGWPVWPALGQSDDEPTFSKSVGDSFSNPALEDWIRALGANGVVLLGAQSDQCVTATVGGALAAGLAVTVVSDAHSTWPWNGRTAAEIINACNQDFAGRGARLVRSDSLPA